MSRFLLLLLAAATLAADSAVQDFVKANNLFTPDIYREIVKKEKGNILVSPFSAETVLAFTTAGAKGKTAQELQTILHLPQQEEKIEAGIKGLLPELKSSSYALHIANKLYLKPGFSIKEDFRKVATEVYSAGIENVDFSKNVQAAKTMNEWVEQQTQNKIQNLIDSGLLNERTRAVLINALYFKAKWTKPFLPRATRKADFYKNGKEVVQVDTMSNGIRDKYRYFECPHLNAKFLEMPYQGEDATLTIVLPNERDGLGALESQIENVFLPHNLTYRVVHIALPKFKIETTIDFKEHLSNLGVKRAFTETQADLSGISGSQGDLQIDAVVQKTFVEVKEEGVEAAAGTFVSVAVPTSALIISFERFIADHPFIFYIKVKGVIVFAGRVVDPQF